MSLLPPPLGSLGFQEMLDPTARAWIQLDSEALAHNVHQLESLLPQGCQLMPAVKANAYGHGAALVTRELNRLGIHNFCVATALEGAELRRQGITGEILVLGYTHPTHFPLLSQYRLTPSCPRPVLRGASGRIREIPVRSPQAGHRECTGWASARGMGKAASHLPVQASESDWCFHPSGRLRGPLSPGQGIYHSAG